MKQEFRLNNTECIKITFPEQRKNLYFSSFNKAGKYLKLTYSTLISSFKKDKGWRIWNQQPIKINVIDINKDIENLIDKSD